MERSMAEELDKAPADALADLLRDPEVFAGEMEAIKSLFDLKGPVMDTIRQEFQELYEGLKRASDNEAMMERKVEEAVAEVSFTREQVALIRRNTDESRVAQGKVLGVLDMIKRKISTMTEVELVVKKEMTELQQQATEYRPLTQRGPGWTDAQLKERAKLRFQEDNLTRACSSRMQVLLSLRQEVEGLTDLVKGLEHKKLTVEVASEELLWKIRANEAQSGRIQSDKLQVEQRVEELQHEVTQDKENLKTLVAQVGNHRNAVLEIDKELACIKASMERFLAEYDTLYRDIEHITEALERQKIVNKQINQDNHQARQLAKRRQKETQGLRQAMAHIKKSIRKASNVILQIDDEKLQWERRRDELIDRSSYIVSVNIRAKRKECEWQQKLVERSQKDEDSLHKRLSASERSMHDVEGIIRYNTSCIVVLQNEVRGFKASLFTQKEEIAAFSRDKSKFESEAEKANRKSTITMEQLKLQDMQMRELQRQIGDSRSRLKQQQNLYEAVRNDRNIHSKKLTEAQQEIENLQSRFRSMNLQIAQIREQIVNQDHILVKEHVDHHSVDKEKETLCNELTKIKKQIYSSEQMILDQKSELLKLNQIIKQAEAEQQREQKEYDAIICERDILGAQLIDRNSELRNLYEKVKLQRSAIGQGEFRYQKSLEEMSLLSALLANSQSKQDSLLTDIQGNGDLRQAIIKLEKQLVHERLKCRALREEKKTCFNVHRWRNMKSSDPQRLGIIRKVQGLQSLIIARSQEVSDTELRIQQKEDAYLELKRILARRPTVRLTEGLSSYENALTHKQKQLQALKAEVGLYNQQVKVNQAQLKECDQKTQDLRRRWMVRSRLSR